MDRLTNLLFSERPEEAMTEVGLLPFARVAIE